MAKILIVDDRETNREFLVSLLGYGGHSLLEASDGAEGLTIVWAEHPDLVIADILMPTMDGYEFVRRLRSDPSVAGTRVVFCTAHYHESEARKLAAACGVLDVLTKPCEPEQVLQTVETALRPNPQAVVIPLADDFDREHLYLMTDKLSQKADELRRTNDRLTAMVELGLQLGSERDPDRLLQSFCNAARQIAGARYAVVGVSSSVDSSYRHLLTSGMDSAMVNRLGRPTPLTGILGTVLAAGRCFRTSHGIDETGAPPSFPSAVALLAAPLMSPARVHGWICLLDKLGGKAFSFEDETLIKMLSAQVGRIYENGSLYADLLRHSTRLAEEIAERKHGETALRESEGLFRGAFEHTGVAMVLIDVVDRLVRVNAAFANMFGYSSAELLGKTLADVTHPDDIAEIHDRRNMLLTGKAQFFQIENRYSHRDGRTFWGMTNLSLVRDRTGRPSLYVGQVQDITERKRAEAEVRRADDLLRAVADGTTDAVFVKDRAGKYLLFNEAAARFVGMSVADVLGKDDTAMFDPESARVAMSRDREVMSTGRVDVAEETLTAAGITRTYQAAKGPYLDDKGNVIGVIGISRDITDRKRAEQRLSTQHAIVNILAAASDLSEAAPRLLKTMCETIGWDAGDLWIVDRQKSVLSHVGFWHIDLDAASEFREESLGQTFAQGVGLPGRVWANAQSVWIADVTKDMNFPRAAAAESAGLRGGFGFPIRFGNEVLGVVDFFSRDSRGPDDEMLRMFESFGSQIGQFIERRRLEDQFRHAQKMEAVGRLAGGVAHDFNNLLTVINGYGELVLDGVSPTDPSRELVMEIVNAGVRASALTRQLLAFSRKSVVAPKVLDLKVVTAEVERMLQRIVGEDIQLTVAVDAGLGSVLADPGGIEQVLLNLVVNARDAMPRGGRLTIKARNVELNEDYAQAHQDAQPGSYIVLEVADTGCGMDAATMARVFEPFFTTKGEYGTGLGLATVYDIVQEAKGHVTISSEVGRGTVFEVYLPRVDERPIASTPRLSDRSEMPRGGETILLVEDEEGVRALSRHVLRGCGYKVFEARDGEEALKLAELNEGRIDLVVTDVVMPRMSGGELSKRLIDQYHGIRVLFLSGYTDDAVVRHGIQETEVAFLQKPFTPASLAAKVREILDDQ